MTTTATTTVAFIALVETHQGLPYLLDPATRLPFDAAEWDSETLLDTFCTCSRRQDRETGEWVLDQAADVADDCPTCEERDFEPDFDFAPDYF